MTPEQFIELAEGLEFFIENNPDTQVVKLVALDEKRAKWEVLDANGSTSWVWIRID